MKSYALLLLGYSISFLLPSTLYSQNTRTEVNQSAKIAHNLYGFGSVLSNGDEFGISVEMLDDLDGDGIEDMAVGAQGDGSGGGAVYILFLNADGSVKRHKKISNGNSGFPNNAIAAGDQFGHYLCNFGDLNNDGISDLAVSSYLDDDGGNEKGAIFILFMDTSGEVKSTQKISEQSGNFSNSALTADDRFGAGIAKVGDLDNDGNPDIVVGAPRDNDGGADRGALYVLYLDTNGTVKRQKKISDTQGSFSGSLDNGDQFGYAVGAIGDLNNDGIMDLAVGAAKDDDGNTDAGAIWVLFMDTNGTVKKHSKISSGNNGFNAVINQNDWFGRYFAAPGDLDGDGVEDLIAGAHNDDDGGRDRGAVWILYLDTNAAVHCYEKISDIEGNFSGGLSNNDKFGVSVAEVPDFDSNGVADLMVGVRLDDQGGTDKGSVYFISLQDPNLRILTKPNKLCQGSQIDLDSKDGKYINWYNSRYQLINTDSFFTATLGKNDTIFYIETGDYEAGCTEYDTLHLTVTQTPQIDLLDLALCATAEATLGPDIVPDKFSFSWSHTFNMIDSTSAKPFVEVTTDTTYVLTSFDSTSGCTQTDTQRVSLGNCSQGACGSPTYQKTYGSTSNDGATSLIMTRDGNLVSTGYTESYGQGNQDVFVMKTALNGDIIWFKTYGGSSDEVGLAITEARNGDLLVLGTTESYGGSDQDMYLLRLDPDGVVEWTRVLGDTGTEIGYGLTELPTGNIAIHMNTTSFAVNTNFSDIALVLLSADGTTVQSARRWGKTNNDAVGNIIQTADRHLMTTGNTENTTIDALIGKYNTDGTQDWGYTYGSSGDDRFFHVIQTHDQHYAAIGYTTSFGAGNNDFFFVKFDADGDVDFAKTFGGTSDDNGYALMQDSRGDYLLIGTTESYGSGNADILLIKMSAKGNLEWAKTYGDTGDDEIRRKSNSLIQVDGGYAFAAMTSVGSDEQILLIKTDFDGNASNCQSSSVSSIGTSSPNVSPSSNTFSAAAFTPSSNTGASTNSISSAKDSLNCDSFCVNFSYGISCGNTPLQFTDETAVGPIAWFWEVYDSSTFNLDTALRQNPSFNLNPGQYYVRLTATNGLDTNSITKKVTVYSTPAYTATNDTLICLGDSVDLQVLGGNKITWWADTTYSRNGIFQRKVGPVTTTQYAFKVEDTIVVCEVSDTINVVVQPLPIVDAGIDTAVCFGDSIALSGTATDSFFWGPNQNINRTDTLNPVVKPNSTIEYGLTAIDQYGCTSIDSVEVRVNSLPTANAGPDTTICEGDQVLLTGSGGADYLWSTNATTRQIQESPTSTTSYGLQVTSSNGCESAFDSVTVFVPALPQTTVSEDDTICFGGNATLTATGGFSYLWNTGDTVSSITVTPTSTTDYTVRAYSGIGCEGNQVSVTVVVHPEFITTISSNDTICRGDSAMLTMTGGDSYVWSTGDSTSSIWVQPTNTTTYRARAINNTTGCISDESSVLVDVKPQPQTFAGLNDSICPGTDYTLNASGGDYFEWNTGAATREITVSPTVDTLYWVRASTDYCIDEFDTVSLFMYPIPVVDIAAPDTICEGDTATLSASGASSYEWSTRSQADTIREAPITDSAYWVTGFSDKGCASAIDTHFLTVSNLPTITVGPSDTICEGQNATLYASGANSYLWETGETNDTALTTTNQDEYFWVAGVTEFGCIGERDSILVVSLEAPQAYLGEDETVCEGDRVVLYPGQGETFLWSTGDDGDSLEIFPTKDTTIWVQPSNVACLGTPDTINLDVRQKTVVSLGPDRELCIGDTANLVATVEDGQGVSIDYNWSTGENTQVINIKPEINRCYWATASINGACESEPDTICITLRPSPIALFDLSTTEGVRPLGINVNNNSKYTDQSEWFLNDGEDSVFIENGPGFEMTLNRVGAYRLTLVASNKYACVDTLHFDSIQVLQNLRIWEWPNAFTPNNDGVNDSFNLIEYDVRGIDSLHGKIFNRWGERVHEWNGQDWWTGEFRGVECPPGVYVFVVDVWDLSGERHRFKGNMTLIR